LLTQFFVITHVSTPTNKLCLSVLKHEKPLFLRAFRVPFKLLKLIISTQKPAKIATLIYENLALTSTSAFVIIFDDKEASVIRHFCCSSANHRWKIKPNFWLYTAQCFQKCSL
jgi:hypothetical protein